MSSLRLAHAQAEEIATILARALRRRESAPTHTRNDRPAKDGRTESPTNHKERPGQRSAEGREHGPGS